MAEEGAQLGAFRWLLVLVVILGSFLSVLDTMAVNISLPYIMTAFGTDIEHAKWASLGFMIAAAITMPLTHWLGQRMGYDLLYPISLAFFGAGAALSAISWSMESLVSGRVLSGIGSGIVQPASVAILTRAFPPAIRGRVFGIWSGGVMLAPIVAPTIAGLLIESLGWRSVYLVSMAISGFTLSLSRAVLKLPPDEARTPLDWEGFLALSAFLGIGLLTFSLGQQEGWDSAPILLGCAMTVIALLFFFVLEWDAPHPLVPLRLFRIPDFSLAMLLTLYKSLVRVGAGFMLPIFLQRLQRRESLQIGYLLTLGPLVNAAANPIVGEMTDRIGSRWLTVCGTLLLVYYLWAYSSLDVHSGTWLILFPQIFRGLGISLIDTPVLTAGVNSVKREDVENAVWMLSLSQRVGGALSVSAVSALLHRQTMIQMEYMSVPGAGRFAPVPFDFQLRDSGLSQMQTRSAAGAMMMRQMAKAAALLAYQHLYWFCCLALATSLLPALLLRGSHAETKL